MSIYRCFALLCTLGLASAVSSDCDQPDGPEVHIAVADGVLNSNVNGRVSLMFAPEGTDPLADTDVSSSNEFFGLDIFDFSSGERATFTGGSRRCAQANAFGYPNVSIASVAPGNYTVQAFLNVYETVTRSDGSTVSVRFPCGDGQAPVAGPGSLISSPLNVSITGNPQKINLTLDSVEPAIEFSGREIGGCNQGNYEDTENLKHLKIRSDALSDFWQRDMYVGANVLLPAGYDESDKDTRYPVVYSQGHWPGGQGAFRYPSADYSEAWDEGTIPGTNASESRTAPKMILVTIRHESPFYDDSYGVNTANIGPYGDAINDELIPAIDEAFNTIAKPYARIAEGGSTGGWISAANVVYRPDIFGACFSSYPDSLDFHRHQAIHLYDAENAYNQSDGSQVPSIRQYENDTEVIVATVEQENHWELTFGSSSRSALQWDAWNAVFGVQGLNNYPLQPWNKVTGEIYHDAVEYWAPFDLSRYISDNWEGRKNLGEVLRNRMFIYVGSRDTYFLNEGVIEFKKNVEAFGGPDWANITVLEGLAHGGNYNNLPLWDYLELLDKWFKDHAPDGETPLSPEVTKPQSVGNDWETVISRGGRDAALGRQSPPVIHIKRWNRQTVHGAVGKYDPGVELEAQWTVNGDHEGNNFNVQQGETVTFDRKNCARHGELQLEVTARKYGYSLEKRVSNRVRI